MFRTPFRERHPTRLWWGMAGSLLAHAAVFGAAWQFRHGPADPVRFGGQRQVIQVRMCEASPTPRPLPELTLCPPEPVATVAPTPAPPLESPDTPTPEKRVVESAIASRQVCDLGELPASVDPLLQERLEPRWEPPRPTATPPQATPRQRTAPPRIAVAAAAPMKPQVLGTDDKSPPSMAGNAPPPYPLLAQQNGWWGTVLLRIEIDATGAVQSVLVERSSGHSILDDAAVKAVRRWRGEPARIAGQAVATSETLPVHFRRR